METAAGKKVSLKLKGCGFCDVATDKGVVAALAIDTVISQIAALPDTADGRKIPFELINENPLPGLPRLLEQIRRQGLRITQIRQMKSAFPDELGYLRNEGGNHGFIHPTPWDTVETETDLGSVIEEHGLAGDILPDHSTPLIIQHASGLGAWIRAIETRQDIRFNRHGSIVAWWDDIY